MALEGYILILENHDLLSDMRSLVILLYLQNFDV